MAQREVAFNVKMTKEERDYYKSIAKRCGVTMTTLIRMALTKEILAVERSIEERALELKRLENIKIYGEE